MLDRKLRIAFLPANDQFCGLDQHRKVDIVRLIPGVVVKVRRILAQTEIVRIHLPRQFPHRLPVIFVQIPDLGERHIPSVKGEEGKMVDKILDVKILQHFQAYLVISTVFIILRKFHVPVGCLDLTVVRHIIHADIRIDRSAGINAVILGFRSVKMTVRIGICQKVQSANTGMLRLSRPEGGRHGAEIGQSPIILAEHVKRSNTVGLCCSAGKVIVRRNKLDGRKLLDREDSPVRIQVNQRK